MNNEDFVVAAMQIVLVAIGMFIAGSVLGFTPLVTLFVFLLSFGIAVIMLLFNMGKKMLGLQEAEK